MLTLKKSLTVTYGSGTGAQSRTLELCYGAINDFGDGDSVEFLCIPALPNDYAPTSASTIEKLYQKGLSVAELAKDKAADYRENSACWLSKDVPQNLPGIKCKKLIVFEPDDKKYNMLDIVGNIFAVLDKYKNSAETSVAIPMMGQSARKIPESDMLTALFYSAVSWQARKFPLKKVKLVLQNAATADTLVSLFGTLADNYNKLQNLTSLPDGYISASLSAREKVASLKNANKLPAYLSERQAFGICVYTTNYYKTINSTLRANNKTSADYKALMPLFESIDTGLANIPPYTAIAYRKDTLDSQRIKEYAVGSSVVHLAYTSTSKRSDIWSGNSVFNIQSLTGSSIEDYSAYPSEQEVMFGRLMINHVKSRDISNTPMVFNIDEKVKPV